MTLASILISWSESGEWGLSMGMVGIIAACIFWGIDNNLTRNISSKNPLSIVTVKGLGAGGFSLILSLLLGRPLPDLEHFSLAMLLGFVSYGMSILLFILAMRGLGTARTSTLFGIAPFVGAVSSPFMLHETPQRLFFVAVPLMLVGAWLMLSEDHSHSHLHLPESHEHSLLEHDHPHTPDIHHRHIHE